MGVVGALMSNVSRCQCLDIGNERVVHSFINFRFCAFDHMVMASLAMGENEVRAFLASRPLRWPEWR